MYINIYIWITTFVNNKITKMKVSLFRTKLKISEGRPEGVVFRLFVYFFRSTGLDRLYLVLGCPAELGHRSYSPRRVIIPYFQLF